MQIDSNSTGIQVSSNVQTDGRMSLDITGIAHLISVLTNLYSDKYLAVLREYSTNARDSHVQAGNPDPIQVTLPTSLNPTLIISDQGVGLSRDELLGIYSRYGASSKRDTNTQVGSFGLGSKSAFTIGGQFIVTARSGGQQVSAVFAMGADGVGTVSILAEHETQESNGVTVSIAVSDPEKMQEAAKRFFLAWKPGTVEVDGEQPPSYYTDPEALWISPDILFTKRGGITVSMGGVSYPLPSSAVYSVRNRAGLSFSTYGEGAPGLVLEVPIGAVDITPSREGIRDTERSLQAVSDVLKTLPQHLTARFQEITGDDIHRIFAARSLLRAAEHLNVKVSSALPPVIRLAPGSATVYGKTNRGGLRTDDLDAINSSTVHLITVLTGVPEKRSAKRHARQWIDDNSNRRMLISFSDSAATQGTLDWFRYGADSPVSTVHFDDIELRAAQRGNSAAGRQEILYQTSAGLLTPSEIKAQPLPVAYDPDYRNSSSKALDGYLIVSLSSRQNEEVFLRRVPTAVPTGPIITVYNDAQLATLGNITALAKGYHLSRLLKSVSYKLGHNHAARITHPTWLAAQRSAAAYNALTSEQQTLVRSRTSMEENTASAALRAALPLLTMAVQTYGDLSAPAIAHLITYANTAP